ncbi:DegT/DnrJ/EryC1/StrS family aminotransferase [Streptomyces sp. NPDC021096]|uniref:DegT/DnrJ/EryC1/StrS family aminotransferase n=1 Tax=Streptomyces sp. NPDC021096 TaxID=3154792 RepID=UPI0033DEE2D4
MEGPAGCRGQDFEPCLFTIQVAVRAPPVALARVGDLDDAARRVTARTKAVIAVHLWGLPEDMDTLVSFADQHGLMLLEDGSHAHGATWSGQRTGAFGTAAAFSLNGPKPLSAGEGGFVATDDSELYYRVLLHGQYNKRCRLEIPADHPLARFAVTGMGLKLRIHPLAAALAHAHLPRLDGYLAGRQAIAARMCAALDDVPGIRVPHVPVSARPSWYALPLRYKPAELGGLPLERFLDAVHAEGATAADRPGSICPLGTHPLFQAPGALLPGYADRQGPVADAFPAAEYVHATTLKLPVWHREEEDACLAGAYTAAITKVASYAKDLL